MVDTAISALPNSTNIRRNHIDCVRTNCKSIKKMSSKKPLYVGQIKAIKYNIVTHILARWSCPMKMAVTLICFSFINEKSYTNLYSGKKTSVIQSTSPEATEFQPKTFASLQPQKTKKKQKPHLILERQFLPSSRCTHHELIPVKAMIQMTESNGRVRV